ncbi:ribbon-helix-helix domain-containing protein [Methyloligella sp. 2.7D]|uniref:ribbon-helix-helix domain-containing protein n=1 Tax=unclassified Methyloligella TaxID=2625955 RepID=UPI00157C041C|nr:ribbon-helix-helix domain-containing protein [Methyloligella sp. GL2]QKP77971.1 ribbon-helix-helix domain-containing protein [Methyloligella sp. GL2]
MSSKRSITIAGHRTSVSVEDPFWEALNEIAETRATSVASLVASIDETRGEQSLSAAIRAFVLNEARARPA